MDFQLNMFIYFLIFWGSFDLATSIARPNEKNILKTPLNNRQKQSYTVCETENCKHVADKILKRMNGSRDPCENFYEYACGSMSTLNPVSKSKEEFINDKTIFTENTQSWIKGTLHKIPQKNDSKPLALEKKFFQACMDDENQWKKGMDTLDNFLKIIGGWPLKMRANEWNEKKFPWEKVAQFYAGIFRDYSLFTIDFDVYPNNSVSQILTLGHVEKDLLPPTYIDHTYNTNYRSADYSKQEEKYLKLTSVDQLEAQQLLDFKNALQQIKARPSEAEPKHMTIDELQKWYDGHNVGNSTAKIDWLEMIRTITNLKINGSEKMILYDSPYFENLIELLKKTSQRTVVNYIHWKFIFDSLKYMGRNELNFFYQNGGNREEFCLAHIRGMDLIAGLNQEYIDSHFTKQINDTIQQLVRDIHEQMGLEILNSKWMDKKTKNLIQQKLKDIKFLIGYPGKNELDLRVYNDLKVGPNYFENVVNIVSLKSKYRWEKFRNYSPEPPFRLAPTEINSGYNYFDNSVELPAAEIISYLYNPDIPAVLNYGEMGRVIGHEISHAFDIQGIQTINISEIMSRQYEKNKDCFIDQFNRYKIYGEATETENAADTAGLIATFNAYKRKIVEKKYNDVRLPNMEGFDGDQLLFLSFATEKCASISPKMVKKWMEEAVHPLPWFRVNAAVSNVKGFSEAFKCSKNRPMNPEHKCFMW